MRLHFLGTLSSLDELAADTAQREGLGDVRGLKKCMLEVQSFEYFDDEFTTLAAVEKDNIRKRALKRFYSMEERQMKAAV